MGELPSQFTVRRIPPDDVDYHRALRLAVDPGPSASRTSKPLVADLLAAGSRPGCSLDLVFGAYQHDRLISTCAALESPGAAALVYVSDPNDSELKTRAVQAALEALKAAAGERSLKLLEILQDPNGVDLAPTLKDAGFRYLTRLLYLRRYTHRSDPPLGETPGLTWVSYTPQVVALFCQALEASYVQSLDCPELTGLRPTTDVLAGHQACGIFDPSLWWVAKQGDRPVGVLLQASQVPLAVAGMHRNS